MGRGLLQDYFRREDEIWDPIQVQSFNLSSLSRSFSNYAFFLFELIGGTFCNTLPGCLERLGE